MGRRHRPVATRVLDAIKRYLAKLTRPAPRRNEPSILCLSSECCPVLRGRGPKFTREVRALEREAHRKGPEAPPPGTQDALSLAEVNFGRWLDFLAY